MHRFFLDPDLTGGDGPPSRPAGGQAALAGARGVPSLSPGQHVALGETDAQHVARVLRLRPGDRITLCDGRGFDYEAELAHVGGGQVTARVLSCAPSRGEPPLHLSLVQGIPKGDKMDLVVQKAVEVGVSRIVPVFTARTVVEWDAAKAQDRRRRWQRIAYEAAKQSHRGKVPVVAPVTTLERFLDDYDAGSDWGHLIVPWEEARDVGLRRVLRALAPGPATVVIGPEGGLEPAEVALAEARGGHTVTLGPRLLRTETAGAVAASIILYEWGDLGGGPPTSP
ncbi:MAG TPA: 16S rRNA (uracil(1498)-N(3))-methyltransferase [Limnochordales bacterium]